MLKQQPLSEEIDSEASGNTAAVSEQKQELPAQPKRPTSDGGDSSVNPSTGNVSRTAAATKRPRQLTRRNTSAAVSHPSSMPRGTGQTNKAVASGRSGGAASNSSTREKGKSDSESSKLVGRKKALSPPATPTPRLLPATPVRRSEKAHLAATRNRPKSMVLSSGSEAQGGVKSTPKKTVSKSKENSPMLTAQDEKIENFDNDGSSQTSVPATPDHSGPSSQPNSKSGGDSREESENLLPPQPNAEGVERKTKHTVAYRDTSPLFKDGELIIMQRVMLL